MTPETSLFEKLLAALVAADVRFVTIGGLACAMCGFVRTTEDMDILVARDQPNIERLLDVLKGIGEGHARELAVADFADEEGAIRLIEDFPVDMFVRVCGHSYESLLPYREWHAAGSARIPYLGPAGLILLKQGSLRDKDRIDVAMLRRLLHEQREFRVPSRE